MKICDNIFYVGVNDREIDLFEGQFEVPEGMAYNSYVIMDREIAVMDSVDRRFGDEWLSNIGKVLGDAAPDYLVVQHMEPDHSANIVAFMEKYPSARIVASDKAFVMMKQFYGDDYSERRIAVKEGDTLSLGEHTLKFIAAPMVHWPEVIVSYEEKTRTLFSADAFGKFGALDADEDWACEARRYYFGIVGKYGTQASNLLRKAEALDIERICPLHGPVLSENLEYYIGLYKTWASYGVESEGVVIAYSSVYGNTKDAALLLEAELLRLGCPKVTVNDLARCDMAEAVEDAFRYGTLVLAGVTYNADLFPFMREFIHELTERGYKKRKIGIIENGSWAPMVAKKIKEAFSSSSEIAFAENTVTIRSALSEENRKEITYLAMELLG